MRVRGLRPTEVAVAVETLAAGMRDNPTHVAVLGHDPDGRVRSLRRLFTALLGTMEHAHRLCAVDEHDRVVAVLAAAPPGGCRPDAWQTARMAWAVAPLGPVTLTRVRTWQRTWQRHDPGERHSHLGPLAVAPDLQGRGVGSRLLRHHLDRLDHDGMRSHLETDKPDNVAFYERHGYTVRGETRLLGTTTWFLGREPRR